ncbi:uncharacterized protein LOC124812556 [Hydra vulgaris]|uniref:uncharacterized protein LOC124812556 n=1 Tax=Hydra vulgaris TaxID=6087 RepID=UPI001F5FA117|nr:uncharacterized protein LOC124812556 [Hydra vulgaris]
MGFMIYLLQSEKFNEYCMHFLRPCDFVSLDKTLYPMRTQVSFKQYNPNKLAKYGLFFKLINVAKFLYRFVTYLYAGKPNKGSEYYHQISGKSFESVSKSSRKRNLSFDGRNLSFDWLYTSLSLADWL